MENPVRIHSHGSASTATDIQSGELSIDVAFRRSLLLMSLATTPTFSGNHAAVLLGYARARATPQHVSVVLLTRVGGLPNYPASIAQDQVDLIDAGR